MDLGCVDKLCSAADMAANMNSAILANAGGGVDYDSAVMNNRKAGAKDIGPHAKAQPHGKPAEPKQKGVPKQLWFAGVEQPFIKPHQNLKSKHRIEYDATQG